MNLLRAILGLLVVGLCTGVAAQAAETVDLTRVAPGYRLFIPTHLHKNPALVVMLHGCNQDAAMVANGTNWNAVAEEQGFLVLYANQPRERNPLNCWNWFLPENQGAGGNEPTEIMVAIEHVQSRYATDRHKLYVAGMSAGGAMAAILLSCYPDRFAGGAIYSGLPYGIVKGVWDAFTVMAQGPGDRERIQTACNPRAFHGGLIVVQGTADTVVNPRNAERLLKDFLPAEGTQSRTTDVPAEGQSLGYHLTTIAASGRLRAERLLVEHADHAWMGGVAGVPYCDPRGPNTTAMIWSFFSQIGRPASDVAAAPEGRPASLVSR